jgi:DNA-binding transcriptional LysR family regulator
MDTTQLAVLRELADRGSVTEVARALGRSPSAVSQQLKTLQRQVGVTLVERVGRGVRLTDAGRALAESSVRIATAVAEAEATWEAYRGEASGVVRIAAFFSASELFVPGLLARLRAHPGITVEIDDRDMAQDEFAALAADYDIVIGHRSDDVLPPSRTALRVVELLREPLDVGVPLDHPLAGRDRLTIDDVIDDDWVSVPSEYPLDRVLTAMAVRAGRHPRVVHRTTHLPLLENLVTAGQGIALLPRQTSRERSAGRFRLVPLADVRAGRVIEALLRPERAARLAVRVVLDELEAVASGLVE